MGAAAAGVVGMRLMYQARVVDSTARVAYHGMALHPPTRGLPPLENRHVGSNVVGGGGGVYDVGGGGGGGGGVGVNAIENGNGDDHGGGGDGGGVGGENPADADAEMRRALSERASRTKAAKEAANAPATPQTKNNERAVTT